VLLGFCQVISVLGGLRRVVVGLTKRLTFWMPFPITLSCRAAGGDGWTDDGSVEQPRDP
jgi:hypothetical protein